MSTPAPPGYRPDDLFHILLDALNELERNGGPTRLGYDGDRANDPKVHEAGCRAIVAMAREYVTDALDRNGDTPGGRLAVVDDPKDRDPWGTLTIRLNESSWGDGLARLTFPATGPCMEVTLADDAFDAEFLGFGRNIDGYETIEYRMWDHDKGEGVGDELAVDVADVRSILVY